MASLNIPKGFVTFWEPGEEFRKKTGTKVQSFVVPPITPVSTGGAGILQKMFGSAQPAKAATQGFPWLVAGGGAVVGAGSAFLFGKKGQEQSMIQQQQPIQITKTYSPVTTTTTTSTYSPSFMNISDSPYATMKKADVITSEPSVGVTPSWSLAPSQSASQEAKQGQAAGTDMALLAAIAAIAVIGYGYTQRKRK